MECNVKTVNTYMSMDIFQRMERHDRCLIPWDQNICFWDGAKYGVRNQNGQILLSPEWDHIECWGDCFYLRKGSKYAAANSKGKLITDPQWDGIELDGDYLVVFKDSKLGLLQYDGTMLLLPEWDGWQDWGDCFLVMKNDGATPKYGVADKTGGLIVAPNWDEVARCGNFVFATKGHVYTAVPLQ